MKFLDRPLKFNYETKLMTTYSRGRGESRIWPICIQADQKSSAFLDFDDYYSLNSNAGLKIKKKLDGTIFFSKKTWLAQNAIVGCFSAL